MCAVIVTALFGGRIELREGAANVPTPRYVFLVTMAPGCEHEEHEFKRALYHAVRGNSEDSTEFLLDTGPLPARQQRELNAWFRTQFGRIRRSSFAIIIKGQVSRETCLTFASERGVPVFLEDTDAQCALIGMTEHELWQEIRQFWRDLLAVAPTITPEPAASVAPDTAALEKLLRELADAIASASPAARAALAAHAETAAAEAAKEDPDPARIKNGLDAIDGALKQGNRIFDSGELLATKLAGLLGKAYQFLSDLV